MKKILILGLVLGSLLTVGCSVKEASLYNIDQSTGKVYSYDINTSKIVEHNIRIENINEVTLLEELKKLDIVSNDVNVIDFKIEGKRGTLNLTKDILEMNIGGGTESLMLDSLSKTYMENYNLDEFVLKVENNNYESGHFYIGEDFPIKRENI